MSSRIKEPPTTPEEIWAILDEITRKHDRFAAATERAYQRAEAERKAEREVARKQEEAYRQRSEADTQKLQRQIDKMEELRHKWAEEDRARMAAEHEAARQQEEAYRKRKEKEEAAYCKQMEEYHKQKEQENAEDRRQREQEQKEYEERFKKVEGIFTGHWGKLMESLVEGDLVNLLRERDINVYDTTMTHKRKYGPDQWQYDIVAHNGEEVVVVEVKTTMKVEDVHDFLYSLSKFRERLSAYRDKRIYGAMAYLRAEEESQVFAQRRGLFVIRATGDSASIINKSGFRPRQFD